VPGETQPAGMNDASCHVYVLPWTCSMAIVFRASIGICVHFYASDLFSVAFLNSFQASIRSGCHLSSCMMCSSKMTSRGCNFPTTMINSLFSWDHTLRASEQHEAMNLAPIAAYSLGRSGIIGFDIRMRFRLFVSRQQAFGEGRSN